MTKQQKELLSKCEPCHEVYKSTIYKSTNEPLIGGALLGEKKMTEEKINRLKAKAFDLIVKSDALFLDEDGNVRIDCPDCQGTNQHRTIGNITSI